MALFTLEFEADPKLDEFVKNTNERLSNNNMLRNPFSGNISHRRNVLIIDMKPLYPNPIWLGALAYVPIVIFRGLEFNWWLLFPLFFLIGAIPHSSMFMFYAFRKGAKKNGYSGKLKLLNDKETIRRIVEWDNMRY